MSLEPIYVKCIWLNSNLLHQHELFGLSEITETTIMAQHLPHFVHHKKKTGLPPLNNVLLVKIEGPGWYTIYHHLPVVFKGFLKNPLIFFINQPPHRIHGAGIYTNMTGLY
jgi:hypothetical protein